MQQKLPRSMYLFQYCSIPHFCSTLFPSVGLISRLGTAYWIYLLIGFYALVTFPSVLVIPVCDRLSWRARWSTFGRTEKHWLIDWLVLPFFEEDLHNDVQLKNFHSLLTAPTFGLRIQQGYRCPHAPLSHSTRHKENYYEFLSCGSTHKLDNKRNTNS